MNAIAAPQDAAELRAQVGRARESVATLEGEITRASERAVSAEDSGDLEAGLKARTRLVSLQSALADAQAKTERLTASLNRAEEEERQHDGRARMASLANDAADAFAARQKLGTKINTFLATNLRELQKLDAKVGKCRSDFIDEARQIGLELFAYARQPAPEAERDALLADLLARGADLSVIRAVPFPPSVIDAGFLPRFPEPWGELIHRALDGQHRMEANRSHLAQLEAEQDARRTGTTQEVA
jgi:hypothetical protein